MAGWIRAIDRVRRGKTLPQRRLAAWLWNRAVDIQPPSDDPLVVFALPLISARRAPDWDQVQQNLRATLDGFRRQSDPNWIAVICGQDEPAFDPDPRISYLRSTVSDKFYDKGDKRRHLIRHISKTVKRDCYYMQFDADDILHPEFVRHVRMDNNGRGYRVDHGYFVDAGSRRFGPLDAPKHAFWTRCGSSSAVRADFRTHTRYAKLLGQHMSHTQIPQICELYGVPLDPVPFPAALYVVGHGQNMVERRGKLAGRLKLLDQIEILDPDEKRRIADEFRVTYW